MPAVTGEHTPEELLSQLSQGPSQSALQQRKSTHFSLSHSVPKEQLSLRPFAKQTPPIQVWPLSHETSIPWH